MRLSQNHLVPMITFALVGCLGLVFYMVSLGYEQVEQEIEVGYKGESLRNPLLAAGRLLDGMGLKTRSFSGLSPREGFPPNDGILVLTSTRYTFGEKRSKDLLSWVAGGGHLIISPRPLDDEGQEQNDHLMMAVEADWGWGASPGDIQANLAGPDSQRDYRLTLNNNMRLFSIGETRPDYSIEEDKSLLEEDEDPGFHFLSFVYDQGLISVLADGTMFHNPNIGQQENAAFFYDICHLSGAPSEVWLVFRESFPNIWSLLFSRAWPILVMLFLLMVATVWFMTPRLGPMRLDPPIARRRLMEHITAAGLFLWDRYLAEQMVTATREAMLQTLRTRHPHWIHLQEEQIHSHIVDRTGLDRAVVAEAMELNAFRETEHFQRVITQIETIRRAL